MRQIRLSLSLLSSSKMELRGRRQKADSSIATGPVSVMMMPEDEFFLTAIVNCFSDSPPTEVEAVKAGLSGLLV